MTTTTLALPNSASELPTLQFIECRKSHAYGAIIILVVAAGIYLSYIKEIPIIAWLSFLTGLIMSAYFVWKAFRKTVFIELSSNTIKHKDYCYGWGRLRSYEIRNIHYESHVGTYLLLNSKNATIPLKICLDVLEDQESFKHQMAIYAKANHIELEKYT